jgi:hypothetical protein
MYLGGELMITAYNASMSHRHKEDLEKLIVAAASMGMLEITVPHNLVDGLEDVLRNADYSLLTKEYKSKDDTTTISWRYATPPWEA